LCVHVAFPPRGSNSSAIAHTFFWPPDDFTSTRGAKARLITRATFVSTSAARRS
jgi:hypothetical protein